MDERREFHRARAREHAARGRSGHAERHRARARFGADADEPPRRGLYNRVREEMPYVKCTRTMEENGEYRTCGLMVMGPVFEQNEKNGTKTKCPTGHEFSFPEVANVKKDMGEKREKWRAEEGATFEWAWECTKCYNLVYGIGDLNDTELAKGATCAFCGHREEDITKLKARRDAIVAARLTHSSAGGTRCAVM